MSSPIEFGKVGVLMGGASAEREISLRTGAGVLKALLARGIEAEAFDPAVQSIADLAAHRFDRVFIALHGRFGEDGTIQGVLEVLGIPYTGSGVAASAIGIDKIMTKRIWQTHGLPTPKYRVLDAHNASDLELAALADELGLPLIVKAPHEGSTLGLAKAESAAAVRSAVELAAAFDDILLAEAFISGRELTVAILDDPDLPGAGPKALPLIEIVAPQGNYDYEHKYFSNDTRYLCPAPLEPALTSRIQALALQAFEAIGCEGWGRVDLMLRTVDGASEPFLLEVNTSPGMTDHSLVPMAAKASGIGYEDLVLKILQGASLKVKRVEKAEPRPPAPRKAGGR